MKKLLNKLKNSSFLQGMGSVMNLGGNYYDIDIPQYRDLDSLKYDGFEKDKEALKSDWQVVGDYMREAMSHLK